MKITINGKDEILEHRITLLDLINLKDLDPEAIVVEYNFEIAKKEEWKNIFIKENDSLEILRFVGGG